MKCTLIDLIVCPACGSALNLRANLDAPDAPSGALVCGGCGSRFPICGGVPDLTAHPEESHPERESFTFEWRLRFDGRAEQASMLWGEYLKDLRYDVRGGGGWYLDLGCGSAERTREVALRNPHLQVVGMDVSCSVQLASARDRDIPNLHYIQADILNPPFRSGTFRFIMALGVLHHTPNTRAALSRTISLLGSGGCLSVWLYPALSDLKQSDALMEYRKWKRYYFLRDSLFAGRSPKLHRATLFALCRLVSLLFSPFGHLLGRSISSLRARFRSNAFILFDNLSPRFQHRPIKRDVMNWFRESGIDKVTHSFRRGGVYTAIKG